LKALRKKPIARELLDLLLVKHAQDVCVPECKNGPTWTAKHLRLDLWAMKKSWSNPYTYGYEIKASRSDFLQDEKWLNYLPYCNYFSFVCLPGLIEPEELPRTWDY